MTTCHFGIWFSVDLLRDGPTTTLRVDGIAECQFNTPGLHVKLRPCSYIIEYIYGWAIRLYSRARVGWDHSSVFQGTPRVGLFAMF